jgi:putative DNA primase/helicase
MNALTDFNDLHQTAGADAVRACIEAAALVEPLPHSPDVPQADTATPWPDPVPLVASIEPEPYPVEALPPTIREAVQEVQDFAQAPMAMVATSALSALSLAAQGLHDVKRAEKLTGPIGLFTLVVADSGERKTTCDEFFTPAIRKWERAQVEAMQPEVERFEADMSAWAAERDGVLATIKECAKKGKPTDQHKRTLADLQSCKPVAPPVPRLIYSDVTPEELGYRLATRWPSAAIASSEAGAVLGSHGMTGDSAMRNMARLNDLWSGQEIQSDRRTSESWTARGARLTVGLQVQESTLRAFFDKSAGLARGTGFLARFLVAWPQSTQGTRMFKDAPEHWPKLAAYHHRIERILNVPLAMDEDGALTPTPIPLSAEAKAMWAAYHDEVEKRLSVGGEYADVRDVASKSADNAARLAALFQIFEHGGGGAVGVDAMEAGCMVAAWHLQEARRFFGEVALPQEVADALRVIQWVKDYSRAQGAQGIATRDLQRLGPVRNKDRLAVALKELQDAHHIRLHTKGKRKWVEVNPLLMEAGQP